MASERRRLSAGAADQPEMACGGTRQVTGRRFIERRWWLAVIVAGVPACLDPLIEDPGATHTPGPPPAIPVAPPPGAPVTPTGGIPTPTTPPLMPGSPPTPTMGEPGSSTDDVAEHPADESSDSSGGNLDADAGANDAGVETRGGASGEAGPSSGADHVRGSHRSSEESR